MQLPVLWWRGNEREEEERENERKSGRRVEEEEVKGDEGKRGTTGSNLLLEMMGSKLGQKLAASCCRRTGDVCCTQQGEGEQEWRGDSGRRTKRERDGERKRATGREMAAVEEEEENANKAEDPKKKKKKQRGRRAGSSSFCSLLSYIAALCMGVAVEELVACCTGGIGCVHGKALWQIWGMMRSWALGASSWLHAWQGFVADLGHDEELGIGSIKLAACMWMA